MKDPKQRHAPSPEISGQRASARQAMSGVHRPERSALCSAGDQMSSTALSEDGPREFRSRCRSGESLLAVSGDSRESGKLNPPVRDTWCTRCERIKGGDDHVDRLRQERPDDERVCLQHALEPCP